MTLTKGTNVDRYVLVEPLGEGGQGAVWKAEDPLDPTHPRALKLVPTMGARPADLERARREARALAALDHPSLVRCHGLFEDLKLGVLGIAMDLVEGTSLRELFDDARLGVREREWVLEHVARALAHLHEQGVVHRDVKLENVLVRHGFWDAPETAEHVKLVDLGIAAVRGADAQLTALGTLVGTLSYLAPEQLDPTTFGDDAPTPALDVFAFGVLGYLLLARRHPTGLKSGAKLADFARAYRDAANAPERWPPELPGGRFGPILGAALRLRPGERPRDGAALVALVTTGPDLIVRPRELGVAAPTSVATPRAMREPTAAHVGGASGTPSRPDSDAATASITPGHGGVSDPGDATRAGRRDGFIWVVVATLAVAATVAWFAVTKLMEPGSVRVAQSASIRPTAPPPLASRATALPVPETDASAEASDAETEALAVVPASPCEQGCRSGRDCGEAGCEAPLEPAEGATLRVGKVLGDAAGRPLFGTYPTARICLSVAGLGKEPRCTALKELEDGGVPAAGLYVESIDLTERGLDVTVENVIPGAGSAVLGTKKAWRSPAPLRRKSLCDGLLVEGIDELPEASVRLYLDDADEHLLPTRCPEAPKHGDLAGEAPDR